MRARGSSSSRSLARRTCSADCAQRVRKRRRQTVAPQRGATFCRTMLRTPAALARRPRGASTARARRPAPPARPRAGTRHPARARDPAPGVSPKPRESCRSGARRNFRPKNRTGHFVLTARTARKDPKTPRFSPVRRPSPPIVAPRRSAAPRDMPELPKSARKPASVAETAKRPSSKITRVGVHGA